MNSWSYMTFILDIYDSLSDLSWKVVDYLSTTVDLGFYEFSVFEILFGGGFIIFIGFVVVKFILDIIL